jgi:hypothetical protein
MRGLFARAPDEMCSASASSELQQLDVIDRAHRLLRPASELSVTAELFAGVGHDDRPFSLLTMDFHPPSAIDTLEGRAAGQVSVESEDEEGSALHVFLLVQRNTIARGGKLAERL